MIRYYKIVRLTNENGFAVAEVWRHDGSDRRILVERKSFGCLFLPSIFNKPLVNYDKAHEWADEKVAGCEWAEGLLHRDHTRGSS